MIPGEDLSKIIECAVKQSKLVAEREIQFEKSFRAIIDMPGMKETLRALSGIDDTVEGMCSKCSFEYRNGVEKHGPGCEDETET